MTQEAKCKSCFRFSITRENWKLPTLAHIEFDGGKKISIKVEVGATKGQKKEVLDIKEKTAGGAFCN